MTKLIKSILTTWFAVLAVFALCAKLYASAPTVFAPMAYAEAHGEMPEETRLAEVDQPQLIPQVQTGLPQRLVIPKIGLNAPMLAQGLTATGNMDVPANNFQVGWLNEWPRPGMQGSSVLSGHWKWRGGRGVFADLNKLVVGDLLTVIDDRGEEIRFKVVRTKLLDAFLEDTSEVFGKTDEYRLNLITCAGAWLPERSTYALRLIVFAERI